MRYVGSIFICVLLALPLTAQQSSSRLGPKAKNTPAWKKQNLTNQIASRRGLADLKGPQYKNNRGTRLVQEIDLIPVINSRPVRYTGPSAKNTLISPARFKSAEKLQPLFRQGLKTPVIPAVRGLSCSKGSLTRFQWSVY